jgi:hypothetical protein
MALDLTEISPNFGRGGANLIPGGSGGSPTLANVLIEHRAALLTLETLAAHVFDATITFDQLGGGATDSILIAGAPTNIILLGVAARANPQFTGEADLSFEVGFEGGDVDALIDTTALHQTGAGTPIAVVQGVVKAGQFYANISGSGLAVLFTATELNDVSAGSLTIRLLYLPTFP